MDINASALRVLHVVDSLERGGLERVVVDLALAQLRAGMLPQVFCLYRTGEFAADLAASGIPVHCGSKRKGIDPRALWRLRLAAAGCEVVHAHSLVPNYYSAAALRWLRRAPVLVNTCHDMGTRLVNPRLLRMYRWSLRYTERFAMVADAVRLNYVARGVPTERAQVICNGIPLDRYCRGAAARLAARARLQLPADALVIGTVGRLVRLKNHASLLRILPSLQKEFARLRLVLVGGGELEGELQSLAAANGAAHLTMFAGNRHDVAELLAAFDLFVLPSTTEGMSISLLEACAAELPSVATRVGGNPSIVQDGVSGLLVEALDDEALASSVALLLRDEDCRRRFGAAAYQWVSRHASMDAMRDAYAAVYRQACARAPGPHRRLRVAQTAKPS